MKRTQALLLVLLLALAVAAQEKAAPKAKPKAAPAGMTMPKPAPEMQKLLKTFVGSWTVAEKHEPGPFLPKGGEGKGEARFFPGPGGRSLIENYHSQNPMGRFSGHGVIWWDPKAGAYTGVWCDNSTPTGCEVGGATKWEGDNMMVGTMDTEMMGKKTHIKGTYTNITPDSFTYTMELSQDGGPMKKVMTVDYTRAAAAPAEKKQ